MPKTVGRNAPCPCGSGLKYKRCCLGKKAPPGALSRGFGEAQAQIDAELEGAAGAGIIRGLARLEAPEPPAIFFGDEQLRLLAEVGGPVLRAADLLSEAERSELDAGLQARLQTMMLADGAGSEIARRLEEDARAEGQGWLRDVAEAFAAEATVAAAIACFENPGPMRVRDDAEAALVRGLFDAPVLEAVALRPYREHLEARGLTGAVHHVECAIAALESQGPLALEG